MAALEGLGYCRYWRAVVHHAVRAWVDRKCNRGRDRICGGALLVIAGVWALSTRSVQFSEWAEVLIGVLLFVAPWVLGFSGLTSMALSAWIAGVLAAVLGGSVLLGERGRRRMAEQH
jgi:VIT1/CCC1 family predicted Fe2+/Mn2+ transporter